MIKTLADSAEENGGVYMMFLDYDVQKMLYDWARERGVARGVLRWMFQYPRGRHSLTGLIRHEPGHAAHVHVRFQCPPGDEGCH
jgi:murein endopeptidase